MEPTKNWLHKLRVIPFCINAFFTVAADEGDKAAEKKNEESTADKEEDQKSGDEKADGGDEDEDAEKEDDKKENGKEKAPPNILKKVGTKKPNGKFLSDIAMIDANLTNTKSENLQVLHTICWDAPGRANMVKKNLRRFNGFDFEDTSDEYKNRREATLKVELSKLKLTADVLDLETGGTVEELVDRIFTFLVKPEPQKPKPKKAAEPADDEEEGSEEVEEEEDEEEPKAKKVQKRPVGRPAGRGAPGRPRRSTAGRTTAKGMFLGIFSLVLLILILCVFFSVDNFSYVDYSSSEEEAPPKPRRRRGGDSESGSDVSQQLIHKCKLIKLIFHWLVQSKRWIRIGKQG